VSVSGRMRSPLPAAKTSARISTRPCARCEDALVGGAQLAGARLGCLQGGRLLGGHLLVGLLGQPQLTQALVVVGALIAAAIAGEIGGDL